MHEADAIVGARPSIKDARRIRLMFCLTVACLAAIALATSERSLLGDPDSWWHIKVGQDLLASFVFPTVDTYSYSFAGQPWIAKEWLGQVLLALAYQADGWNGVATLVVATICLTLFLMARLLGIWLKPIVAIGLAVVMIGVVSPIYTARPHIFTLPIILIWTAGLFDAAREQRVPSLWLLCLVVLWANLHASFTLAFVIVAFAGLDLLARAGLARPVLLMKWVAFGLLCPLVSLLHPYGVKAILATFTVAYGNEAVPMITEWRPFNAQEHFGQEAALLLMLIGLLVSRFRTGWSKALFVVFTLHVYLIHMRFMYLFFLLVPVVLAVDMSRQFPSLSFASWMAAQRDGLEKVLASRFRQICGVGATLLLAGWAAVTSAHQVEPSQKTSAKDALAFAERHQLSGNVLNSYDFGGTLIFHGIKTFIDGRTDQLFLNGFTKVDDDMGTSGGKPILEAQLKKYAIRWALLTTNDDRIPFFDELGWKRVYADDYAVIYLPGG